MKNENKGIRGLGTILLVYKHMNNENVDYRDKYFITYILGYILNSKSTSSISQVVVNIVRYVGIGQIFFFTSQL